MKTKVFLSTLAILGTLTTPVFASGQTIKNGNDVENTNRNKVENTNRNSIDNSSDNINQNRNKNDNFNSNTADNSNRNRNNADNSNRNTNNADNTNSNIQGQGQGQLQGQAQQATSDQGQDQSQQSSSSQSQTSANNGNSQGTFVDASNRSTNTYVELPEAAVAPLPVGNAGSGGIGDIVVPLPGFQVGAFYSNDDNAGYGSGTSRNATGVTAGFSVPLGAGEFREAARNEVRRRAASQRIQLIKEAVWLQQNDIEVTAEAFPEHYAAMGLD